MEADVRQLIQTIHDQPGRIVLVTAGAGTYALAWLLGVAGASRTLVEALIPYDWQSFDDFLGQTPAKYVEATTARLMAGRAFTRARWLIEEDEPLIGFACTATIVTDRPKKGAHRAHIAIWQPERVSWYHLKLAKGKRNRSEEEGLVSRFMLNGIAEAFDISQRLELAMGEGDEIVQGETDIVNLVNELMMGKRPFFHLRADGALSGKTSPMALLSGAFNPLHDGHLSLAQVAEEMTGLPAAFEIAALNADKPTVPAKVTLWRLGQFAGRWQALVSNAATFAEKALLYPGTTFVVGFDTAARVLEWRFYEGSKKKMMAAMETIRQQGCRFLVAGRLTNVGRFQEAYELKMPASVADLFEPIPSHRFRRDISSTDLRNAGKRGSR